MKNLLSKLKNKPLNLILMVSFSIFIVLSVFMIYELNKFYLSNPGYNFWRSFNLSLLFVAPMIFYFIVYFFIMIGSGSTSNLEWSEFIILAFVIMCPSISYFIVFYLNDVNNPLEIYKIIALINLLVIVFAILAISIKYFISYKFLINKFSFFSFVFINFILAFGLFYNWLFLDASKVKAIGDIIITISSIVAFVLLTVLFVVLAQIIKRNKVRSEEIKMWDSDKNFTIMYLFDFVSAGLIGSFAVLSLIFDIKTDTSIVPKEVSMIPMIIFVSVIASLTIFWLVLVFLKKTSKNSKLNVIIDQLFKLVIGGVILLSLMINKDESEKSKLYASIIFMSGFVAIMSQNLISFMKNRKYFEKNKEMNLILPSINLTLFFLLIVYLMSLNYIYLLIGLNWRYLLLIGAGFWIISTEASFIYQIFSAYIKPDKKKEKLDDQKNVKEVRNE